MTLADTNLLLRYADPHDPDRPTAVAAVAALFAAGPPPVIVPQNLYEFWVVATRPRKQNGLGMTTPATAAAVSHLKGLFPVLPEPLGLLPTWESLVLAHDCKGKVAHDARLVAAMRGHGLTHILTFNGGDFSRFPGIVVLDPNTLAGPLTP